MSNTHRYLCGCHASYSMVWWANVQIGMLYSQKLKMWRMMKNERRNAKKFAVFKWLSPFHISRIAKAHTSTRIGENNLFGTTILFADLCGCFLLMFEQCMRINLHLQFKWKHWKVCSTTQYYHCQVVTWLWWHISSCCFFHFCVSFCLASSNSPHKTIRCFGWPYTRVEMNHLQNILHVFNIANMQY